MQEKQELELLAGFRRLCPADRNTVITVVSMAVSAEDAVKRCFNLLPESHPAQTAGGKPAT
jgi:hypothetical protein